ncbi:hypothetical protein ACSBR1_036187 [Camellia fascicularis]
MLIKEKRQNDGTNPSQRSSDLLQSTPYDNLPTSVNEVGSVTESIEAMKLSKRAGSSIANLLTGLDTDQNNGVELRECQMQVVALGGDKLGGCGRPDCIKGSQVKGASCDSWTFVLESMGEPRNSPRAVVSFYS